MNSTGFCLSPNRMREFLIHLGSQNQKVLGRSQGREYLFLFCHVIQSFCPIGTVKCCSSSYILLGHSISLLVCKNLVQGYLL